MFRNTFPGLAHLSAVALRRSSRFLPQINILNADLDKLAKEPTNTSLRRSTIDKFLELRCQAGDGHRVSEKFYSDHYHPLARRMHSMDLVDFRTNEVIPFNTQTLKGDRSKSQVLHAAAVRENDHILDIHLANFYRSTEKDEQRAVAAIEKYVDTVENLGENDLDLDASAQYVTEQLLELQDAVTNIEAEEELDSVQWQIASLGAFIERLQETLQKHEDIPSHLAQLNFLADLQTNNFYTNRIKLGVASEIRKTKDEPMDLDQFKARVDEETKNLQELKKLLDRDNFEERFGYEDIDIKARKQMLLDSLDIFSELLDSLDFTDFRTQDAFHGLASGFIEKLYGKIRGYPLVFENEELLEEFEHLVRMNLSTRHVSIDTDENGFTSIDIPTSEEYSDFIVDLQRNNFIGKLRDIIEPPIA